MLESIRAPGAFSCSMGGGTHVVFEIIFQAGNKLCLLFFEEVC